MTAIQNRPLHQRSATNDPHTCNACRGGYNRADDGEYAVMVKTTTAAIISILSCALIAYSLDGTLGGHGPIIATGQTALPLGLPAWMGSGAG